MPVPADWLLESSEEIASLWSGYGVILRNFYGVASNGEPTTQTTILKRVAAPTKRDYDESHVRKMLSYDVERYFYTHLAPLLDGTRAHIAHVYECTPNSVEMGDLCVQYPVEAGTLKYEQTKVVIRSLAAFHATLWATEYPTVPPPSPTSPPQKDRIGIWEEGSYWYLRTRNSEYERLTPQWQEIACKVDAKIRTIPAEFRTVIHGDTKSANIMFSEDGTNCALYDLQYTGYGPGVRDLSKFFVSSVRGLSSNENDYLRYYYDELMACLKPAGKGKGYTFEIMIDHYELCFVDYYRFMKGWGFWGDIKFAEVKVQEILKKREEIRA